jgi:hypothetical protein
MSNKTRREGRLLTRLSWGPSPDRGDRALSREDGALRRGERSISDQCRAEHGGDATVRSGDIAGTTQQTIVVETGAPRRSPQPPGH